MPTQMLFSPGKSFNVGPLMLHDLNIQTEDGSHFPVNTSFRINALTFGERFAGQVDANACKRNFTNASAMQHT